LLTVVIGNETTQFHFGEYLIKFSGQCISNAASSRENNGSCIREKENNTCHTDIKVYSLLVKWKIQETLVYMIALRNSGGIFRKLCM
jgi:hypothetical protein